MKEKEEVGPEASGTHSIFCNAFPQQEAGYFNAGAGALAQVDKHQNAKQGEERECRWIEDAHTQGRVLSGG